MKSDMYDSESEWIGGVDRFVAWNWKKKIKTGRVKIIEDQPW